jgi:hypothetical protein
MDGIHPAHCRQAFLFICLTFPMIAKTSPRHLDLFSRFMNWLSSSWPDREPTQSKSSGKDPLSRFVNSISG